MSWNQTGSCPKCGAPIYSESPFWSVTPPPPRYSCSCVSQRGITTTSGTEWKKPKKSQEEAS